MGSGGIIAAKIGCAAQTLHEWVKKTEIDSGPGRGLGAAEGAAARGVWRHARHRRPLDRVNRQFRTPTLAPTMLWVSDFTDVVS